MNKLLQKLLNTIKQDNLFRNIFIVSSGMAFAQLVKIVTQPIITRIYTPEEYGIMSVFVSFLTIFQFATFRYEVAIPLADDEDEARDLTVLSFGFLFVFIILLSGILTFWGDSFLKIFNSQSLYSNRYLIPIGLFFFCAPSIFTEWMYRLKKYKVVMRKQMLLSIIGNGVKVILGFLGLGTNGLLVGQVMGDSLSTWPMVKELEIKRFRIKEILPTLKATANKYKSFPLFQTPGSFAIHGRNQIPVIFLASIYGGSVAGYYGLANSIINLPMTIIGQSVMKVFFSEIATIGKENPKQIKKISKKLFVQLSSIIIIPMLILVIFGPNIISLIFGKEWIEAGIIIRILSLYVLPDFVLSPISRVFELFNKQHIKMIIDITSLLIITILFLSISYLGLNVNFALTTYSMVMLVTSIVTYFFSVKILNEQIKIEENNSR